MRIPKPKKIKFGHMKEYDLLYEGLKPVKKHVPEWYKKAAMFIGEQKIHVRNTGLSEPTVKHCGPFGDSFMTGYVIELWQDLEVIQDELKDGVRRGRLAWPTTPIPVQERTPAGSAGMPIPHKHMPNHYIWESPLTVKLPKGYSMLITHPLNRFDLPFTTLSAVVDADTLPMGPGAVPFFIHDDFEGIIPRGTPIFQVIPFKRESWVAEKDETLGEEGMRMTALSYAYAHGFYKRFAWAKKDFN